MDYDKVVAERVPDIRIDFNLVGHGYEWRMFVDGKEIGFFCRDFSGTHRVSKVRTRLARLAYTAIQDVMEKLRNEF